MPQLKALLCLLFLCNSVVFAESNQRALHYSVTNESWAPYWIVKKGVISGIFSDIMVEMDQRISIPIKPIKPLPLNRAKLAFENGQVQIECCVNQAWRSEPAESKVSLWSETVLHASEVLIFPKGKSFEYKDFPDLAGKQVATILGYGYVGDQHFRRVDVKDNQAQVRMVAYSRVDAAIIDLLEFQYLFTLYPELNKLKQHIELGPEINSSALKIRVHNSQPQLLEKIDQEILRMRQQELITKTINRYVNDVEFQHYQ